MNRLIILSDLWGAQKSQWSDFYFKKLQSHFEVQFYDVCELGEIDLTDYSQDNLHQQFLSFGIDKAVQNLLEKETESIYILGMSIGGVMGWKAILKGLKAKYFVGISATRLRYETESILCPCKLIYGEIDNYKPDYQWFEDMNLPYEILTNYAHDLYENPIIVKKVTDELKNSL